MKWNVVVLDKDVLIDRTFNFNFDYSLDEYGNTKPEETAQRIAGKEVVITNKVQITAELMAANPQLKLIAVSSTGYNIVDIDAAKKAGITVCNIRSYSSEAVAEHVMMFILALMRGLPSYERYIVANEWEKSPLFCHFGAPIRDLSGKTLAIFGRGDIGKTLEKYASAFNLNVIFGEHKNAEHTREGYVSFEEAISKADIVSLNCPLTESTRNMIGEAELKKMKPRAILINCARGGLVDEAALAAALEKGHLGGAGFDVLTNEPPRNGNPLLANHLPNLIVTPHVAWTSEEAQNKLFDILTDNINNFVANKPQNVIV